MAIPPQLLPAILAQASVLGSSSVQAGASSCIRLKLAGEVDQALEVGWQLSELWQLRLSLCSGSSCVLGKLLPWLAWLLLPWLWSVLS